MNAKWLKLKITLRLTVLGIAVLLLWLAYGPKTIQAIAGTVEQGLLPRDTTRGLKMQTETYLYFFPIVSEVRPWPADSLPPIYWDPRLGPGGLPHLENVRIIPANVGPNQKYWRAVKVVFQDVSESGNDHTIYVTIVDENWNRVDGERLQVFSDTSGEIFPDQPTEKPAGGFCNRNYEYPLFGDGYDVRIVGNIPSDTVAGMVMPMRRHVNYLITFQRNTNP